MDPRKIRPNYTPNAAVKYDVQSSPLNQDARWIAGSNILTSIKGYAERRPGFPSKFESGTATVFATAKRIFGWRKWNGSFFIIVNEITSTASKLYYYIPGISTVFTLFFTSTMVAPFDFVVFNDALYCANGGDMIQWNGDQVLATGVVPAKWGIAFPTAPPVVTLAAVSGGPSASIGYSYVYCWKTKYGQISSPSPASASTGPYTEQLPSITFPHSTDPQELSTLLFRTTDGGGAIYFQIPGEWTTGVGTGANQTITDQNTDLQLFGDTAPPPAANDPPSSLRGVTKYASRLWGFKNDEVWFSNNEEQTTGLPEQSFTPTNKFRFGAGVQALQPVNEGLLVHCDGPAVFKISGDSLDTFRQDPFLTNMGAGFSAATASVGKAAAWLDTANLLRISDGYSQTEFSLDIRPDIAAIDQAQAQLCYHSDGRYQLGILMDGAAGKLRVYDLDTQQWMPPWAISGTAIASVLVAVNTRKVLIAHSSGKILQMDYTTYTDNDAPFTATGTLSLIQFAERIGRLGLIEYIALERDSKAPSKVEVLVDEDATVGTPTFADLTANVENPDLRPLGTNLVEQWYKDRGQSARPGRKASVRITWPTEDANFKLYSFDVAGSDMQNAG